MPDSTSDPAYLAAVDQLQQLPDRMRQAGCPAPAVDSIWSWIQQTVLPMIRAGGNEQMANGTKVATALTFTEADLARRYGQGWRDNPEAMAQFDQQARNLANGLAHPEEGGFM